MSLFVLAIDQVNRSVSLLGFDNQAASATCQAAWLRNTSLVLCSLGLNPISITDPNQSVSAPPHPTHLPWQLVYLRALFWVVYYFQFTFRLSVPSLLLTISSTSSTLTILNCTSPYPPQTVRFQSPGSNPVSLTSTAGSHTTASAWVLQNRMPLCLVLSKGSTHFHTLHPSISQALLYTLTRHWICSDTSVTCVNLLTTTSVLSATSEPLC